MHVFPCGGREWPVVFKPPPWYTTMVPVRGQVVLLHGKLDWKLWKTKTPQPMGHGQCQYLVQLKNYLWPMACGLWPVACGLWPVACGPLAL